MMRKVLSGRWLVVSVLAAAFCLLPAGARAQTLVTKGVCAIISTTCTITLSLTSGDYVLCGIGTDVDTYTLSCSDNESNSYSTCHSIVTASGPNTEEGLYCASVGTTASTTITCTRSGSGGSAACIAVEYSGLASSPTDQTDSGNANNSTTSFTSGTTSTTSQASELLVGLFFAYSAPSSCSAANSFTVEDSESSGGLLCFVDKSVTSTGTYQASTTYSSSASGPGLILTLKVASAAAACSNLINLLGAGCQ